MSYHQTDDGFLRAVIWEWQGILVAVEPSGYSSTKGYHISNLFDEKQIINTIIAPINEEECIYYKDGDVVIGVKVPNDTMYMFTDFLFEVVRFDSANNIPPIDLSYDKKSVFGVGKIISRYLLDKKTVPF